MYEEEIERDIFDKPINHKEAGEARKSLGLPSGQYRTVPVLTVDGKTNDDGRRSARFFGEVAKDGVVKGKIGFGFSPDLRYKDNDEGEQTPDWNYKQYLYALRAYKETTGEDAESETQVVQFVANYPVMLTIAQSKDTGESFVTKISKARD